MSDTQNAIVRVADVTKQFGSTVAVKSINLHIDSGEFFCFLGPSGCGKTTLLRMIAGFETPTTGRIFLNGSDVTKLPPHKRPLNMVFQNYALFPHLSIAQNVAFALNLRRVEKSVVAKKVDEALELVRLRPLKDRVPAQLSGGQQQRAALARALVNDPSVLLLDEPLSALDPQIREEMQSELANLQKQLGMTFIMVTHDQSEALALSSRIAVFSGGKLEQVDTPLNVFESPRSIFVANFIGQTNVISGTVIGVEQNGYRVRLGPSLDCFVENNQFCYTEGQPIQLLIKPHQIELVRATESNDENDFVARVLRRSFAGASNEFIAQLAEGVELRISLPRTSSGANFSSEYLKIHLPPKVCKLLSEDK